MKYSHPTQIPRSKSITGLEWTGPLISCKTKNHMGDSFPVAWADDDALYAGAGDPNWLMIDGVATLNRAFTEEQSIAGYSKYTGLTVEKFTGKGDSFEATRVNDMDAYVGWGGRGPKPTGMLCVDGVLYYAVQNLLGWKPACYGIKSQHASDATIIKSVDHGKTWTPCLDKILIEMEKEMSVRFGQPDRNGDTCYWLTPPEQRAVYKSWIPMFPGCKFGGPSFVQFGRNNATAVDDYVYAISSDQWDNGTELRIGRVHKDFILERSRWEFANVGVDRTTWETDLNYSKPVLSIERHLSTPEMVYIASIKKYLLATWALHTDFNANDGSELTILESDNPWGPFSLVHYEWMWYKEEAGFYCPKIPLKWFDEEKLTGHMLISGNWISYDKYYHAQTMAFKLKTNAKVCK